MYGYWPKLSCSVPAFIALPRVLFDFESLYWPHVFGFWHAICFACCQLFGILFNTEDGGSVFLRNIGELLPDYMEKIPEDSILNFLV
jgi:hypothetical protein